MATTYVVLHFESEDELKKHVIGAGEASSPDQAVKAATKDAGIFLAVAKSNFHAINRKRDQRPVDTTEPITLPGV